jgi:hypothetical protein
MDLEEKKDWTILEEKIKERTKEATEEGNKG